MQCQFVAASLWLVACRPLDSIRLIISPKPKPGAGDIRLRNR